MDRDTVEVIVVSDTPPSTGTMGAHDPTFGAPAGRFFESEPLPRLRFATTTPQHLRARPPIAINPAFVVLDDLSPAIATEVCAALRAAGSTAPVILIAGHRFARATVSGVDHVLTKEELRPGDLHTLIRLASTLERSGREADAIVAVTGDGVVEWDLGSSRVRYSPAWKTLLGYRAEQVGTSVDEWLRRVHPDDVVRLRTRLTALLESDEEAATIESRLLCRDGQYRWVECRLGWAAKDRLIGVFRDVHDRVVDDDNRRRREDYRRHAEKIDAITRLAGGIAHDFNNLLLVILGYSDFILTNLGSRHPLYPDLTEIKRAGQQARELTQQLLSFGGRQEATPENLDLVRLVRDGLPLVRRILGEEIQLSVRSSPAPITIHADSGQLRQAVVHLVVHARDLLEGRGAIELDVDRSSNGSGNPGESSTKGAARIRVDIHGADRGPDRGDAESTYTPSHFEPEVPLETPERYGFGLSMVENIVERHGGRLQVDPGPESTRVQITLPLADPARVDRAPQPDGSGFSSELPSATIVLVDDNPMVRSLVRHILIDHGYRVLVASSGEEAMHICAQHGQGVDLLLTDVVMPRVGGRELADRLGAMIPGLPVLYMSGFTGDQLSEHGVAEDRAFIPKPFTSAELGTKVREMLT